MLKSLDKLPAGKGSLSDLVGQSSFVRMFKPQFAPLVESGIKLQTVRPTPKRMPRAGDRISLRSWTGNPYRSKQRVLREATIEWVGRIMLFTDHGEERIMLDGLRCTAAAAERFARADGFPNSAKMFEWFVDNHGPLPFRGISICWSNAPSDRMAGADAGGPK